MLKAKLILFSSLLVVLLVGYKAVASSIEGRSISALSWAVAGRLIVVDPGHGGDDPGAVGRTGAFEKDIVLAVAKNLASILSQAGAEAVLTRENDLDLSDAGLYDLHVRKMQDLSRRVALANNREADLFISIHVNSFPDVQENGAQAFSQPGSTEGRKLSRAIQHELNRFLAYPGREAKQVDYYICRMVKMPGSIVEIGFISNPEEEKLMLDPNYQYRTAWAIYAGIVRYFAQSAATGEK